MRLLRWTLGYARDAHPVYRGGSIGLLPPPPAPTQMNQNLHRFDLSDRLIHFTRKLDQLDDSASVPELPIEWGLSEWVEDDVLSPFFLLRHLVRKRQILSTRSLRGGRPTIYGPSPAVCFTEMPVAAFLRASTERAARGERVSSYALLLRKDHAFEAGARPAIYSLSEAVFASDREDGTRWLPTERLPAEEQYRFVAFDPTRGGRLDWTHEREWRWPNRQASGFLDYDIPREDDPRHSAWESWSDRRYRDRAEEDGLCFDAAPFRDIGLLVQTQRQAKLLTHDVLWLADAEITRPDLYSFLLVADELDHDDLVDPARAARAFSEGAIDLAPYFRTSSNDEQLQKRFGEIVERVAAQAPPHDGPHELGGCWLWLADNTHPLLRALLRQGRVSVSPTLPRYLVQMYEYSDSWSLRARETLTKAVAVEVEKEFGVASTYYSVLNSDEVDGIPSYTDVTALDEPYINYAHHDEDF